MTYPKCTNQDLQGGFCVYFEPSLQNELSTHVLVLRKASSGISDKFLLLFQFTPLRFTVQREN